MYIFHMSTEPVDAPRMGIMLIKAARLAQGKGHAFYGTGHLLYTLVMSDDAGPAKKMLLANNVTSESLGRVLETTLTERPLKEEHGSASPELVLAIDGSRKLAKQHGKPYVYLCFLVQGLLAQENCDCSRLLDAIGVSRQALHGKALTETAEFLKTVP